MVRHPSNIPQPIVERVLSRRGSLYVFPSLNPARTALVVIDLDMGTGRDAANLQQLANNVNQLAEALRNRNGIVVWVTTPIQKATTNFRAVFGNEVADNYERMGQPDGEATKLWPELKPRPQDIRTTKQGHSAFFPGRTTLHEQLQAKGIESIFIAGAVTNVCCEASARDAAELQYKVTMVSDALKGQSAELDQATLTTFFRCYGDVRTTKDALALINNQKH
jgi:nicotinamidase-related amidase